MPSLVLPPPEQPPPSLSEPYRPPGAYPRAGDQYSGSPAAQYNGASARQFSGASAGQFSGSPAGQYNGAGGRPPLLADEHFNRPDGGLELEEAAASQYRGGAGPPPRALTRPPPLPVLPPLAGLGVRRSFSQRTDAEADYSEPYVKRGRFGDPIGGGLARLPTGPPPLGGLSGMAGLAGPQARSISLQPHRSADMGGPPPAAALRSAVAISERIKSRLHAPMDVVVANFTAGTNEHDLMTLFERFEPLNVRIMVNNSSQYPDDFTYAYVTLSSRMMADEAVMEMDGLAFQGRPLVVEARKN